MKIGFLCNLSESDITAIINGNKKSERQSFLMNLPDYYTRKGHEVVLVACSSRQRRVKIRYGKLTVYIVPMIKKGTARAILNFSDEIRKMSSIIKKEKCDIIHAHWCYETAMAGLKADASKTIITLHDWPDIVCPLFENYYWTKRQQLGDKVLRQGKFFTAVSPYISELYKKEGKGEIKVIPNYLSEDLIALPNEKRSINQIAPKLLSVNIGFGKRKNVKTLIRAFESVKEKIPGAELHLYGSGYEENGQAYQWTEENSSTNGIIFHGSQPRERIIKALKDADILVHPSIEESFGMTLIEAMANHTLVVAGENSGAVPWVLGHGKYGVLVDIHDPEKIAKGVISAVGNELDTEMMLNNAYEYVLKKYSFETIADSYLEYYHVVALR